MDYTILLLAIPFLMFLFIGLLGYKMSPKTAGLLGTAGLSVVTVLAYYTAYVYFFQNGMGAEGVWDKITVFNYTWLDLSNATRPDLRIEIGMLLDPISVMMLIVITTVSLISTFTVWDTCTEKKDSSVTMRYFRFSPLPC